MTHQKEKLLWEKMYWRVSSTAQNTVVAMCVNTWVSTVVVTHPAHTQTVKRGEVVTIQFKLLTNFSELTKVNPT